MFPIFLENQNDEIFVGLFGYRPVVYMPKVGDIRCSNFEKS